MPEGTLFISGLKVGRMIHTMWVTVLIGEVGLMYLQTNLSRCDLDVLAYKVFGSIC